MLGELVPTGGGDAIPLLKAKLLIGRRDECDIMLRFPNVSSHHCELELMDGYWHIRDLNSSNGIKVNGVRCDSNWLLPGDEVAIARHRFEVKYQAVGPAPQPKELDISTSLMEKAGLSPRRDDEDDDVDMSRGLLEKAGLERRPNRPSGSQRPAAVPPTPAPPARTQAKKPDSDESIALKWLQNDD